MNNHDFTTVKRKTKTVSSSKPGTIKAGNTEVDYDANVRIVRDKVIELTGAVPHKDDELYLVYDR